MAENGIDIQLRCAEPEELEDFLHVMCRVFDLPFEIAKIVFFSDPFLNNENNLVLMLNSQIVSCLTLLSLEAMIGGNEVRMGGIAGLATLPEHQRKGYAARLMNYAFEVCKERDLQFVVLDPSDINYYRKRGWFEISRSVCYELRHEEHDYVSDEIAVRSVIHDDLVEMDFLRFHQMKHSLGRVRGEINWMQIVKKRPKSKVAINETGEVVGYMLVEEDLGHVGLSKPEVPPGLVVVELYAEHTEAANALLSAIHEPGFDKIDIMGEENELATLGVRAYPPKIRTAIAPSMGRLISFQGMLNSLLSILPEITDPVKMECRFEKVIEVITLGRDCDGRLIMIDDSSLNCYHHIAGNEEGWLKVLTGYLSAEEALTMNLLSANSDYARETAISLFPARHPHMSEADRF